MANRLRGAAVLERFQAADRDQGIRPKHLQRFRLP